jgi:hypothetical protein
VRRALITGIAILALATLARAEPPHAVAASTSTPQCPPDFALDPPRAARIRRDLDRTDATDLLRAAQARRPLAFCFGPIDRSVVRDDGLLLLDARLPRGADSARVAHLFHHVVEFPDLDAPAGPPCETLVAQALDSEARALATEIHLRAPARLDPIYEIEAECAREPLAACTRRMRAYLDAHPHGAPGIDPLAIQYGERCTRARRR